MSTARLRFAPSPTGFLHIGGARTAIFNWLYARHLGGKFILRIEDTDRERSRPEYETEILEALAWLGLDWDEEPIRQSTRLSFYRELVDELIERGAAYRDFLTPDETEKLKAEKEARGDRTAFRSPSRNLDHSESESLAAAGKPFAVRFRVPDKTVSFKDGVHGMIEVGPDTIEDFVLLRTDGTPTYQVAVVADDIDMGVTQVIRGDDHVSNTPKQILIYEALNRKIPEFAHVPLILGPDKKRLSKRHGATAVTEYRTKGYLPDSILSYLALLGWSPGNDQEIFTRDELVKAFTVEGINNKSAVFDEQKLEWMNGQFLSVLPDEEIEKVLRPDFAKRVAEGRLPKGSAQTLKVAVSMLKTRSRFPLDILDRGEYFFKDPESYDADAAKKRLKEPAIIDRLDEMAKRFESLVTFNQAATEETLRLYSEELGVNGGALIHPIRLAISGQSVGPGLFELLEVLGREAVVRRIRTLVDLLRKKGTPPTFD